MAGVGSDTGGCASVSNTATLSPLGNGTSGLARWDAGRGNASRGNTGGWNAGRRDADWGWVAVGRSDVAELDVREGGSTYYWFGEDKSANSALFKAVSCYSVRRMAAELSLSAKTEISTLLRL